MKWAESYLPEEPRVPCPSTCRCAPSSLHLQPPLTTWCPGCWLAGQLGWLLKPGGQGNLFSTMHTHSGKHTHTHTHTHTLTDSGKHTHTHTHILTGQWEKDGERSSHSLTPALQSGGGSGPQVPPRDESTQALLPQGVSTQALTRPG